MMTEETKARLKAMPTRRCVICKTPKSYTNPIAKCWKCGHYFCYDHIWASLGKKEVEDYCDDCRNK